VVKARRKPEEVKAVRWRPGAAVYGCNLKEHTTEIHYSESGDLYYISRPGCQARHWLSTVPVTGEPSDAEKQKAGGFFGPMIAQFSPPDGRPTYWRKVYAFATTKVRSGKVLPIAETGDLFLDAASLERWPKERVARATLDYGTMAACHLKEGDWIVTTPGGTNSVMTDEEFCAQYDVVGD
jgi:hypothetical protein